MRKLYLNIKSFFIKSGRGIHQAFWHDILLRDWLFVIFFLNFLVFPLYRMFIENFISKESSYMLFAEIAGILGITFLFSHFNFRRANKEGFLFTCWECRARRKMEEKRTVENKVYQSPPSDPNREMWAAVFKKDYCERCYYKSLGNSASFIMD